MDLRSLAGHTVDVSLLPGVPFVLDAGCRGFDFSRAVLATMPSAQILAIDPDHEVERSFIHNPIAGVLYQRVALASEHGRRRYVRTANPAARYLAQHGERIPGDDVTAVDIVALLADFKEAGGYADLIKLDIEGAEFEVLERWPRPMMALPGQISVEFHDYKDNVRWNSGYFNRLFAGPLRSYDVIQHDFTAVSGGRWGHWDTLLIRKDLR